MSVLPFYSCSSKHVIFCSKLNITKEQRHASGESNNDPFSSVKFLDNLVVNTAMDTLSFCSWTELKAIRSFHKHFASVSQFQIEKIFR